MAITAAVPPSSARGSTRAGSLTSPATKVRSAHPSYAHITATSAIPKPPHVVGAHSMGDASAPAEPSPRRKAAAASPTSVTALARVDAFCTRAPHFTDRMLAVASVRMAPAATIFTPASVMGTKVCTYSAKSMAIPPSADGRITSSSVHPKRKAGSGPYASRRNT